MYSRHISPGVAQDYYLTGIWLLGIFAGGRHAGVAAMFASRMPVGKQVTAHATTANPGRVDQMLGGRVSGLK